MKAAESPAGSVAQARPRGPNPLGRPLVPAALALAAGIWAADLLAASGSPRGVGVAAAAVLGAAVLRVVRARRVAVPGSFASPPWWKRDWVRVALVGVALLVADLRTAQVLDLPPGRIDGRVPDGAQVVLEGRVVEDIVNDVRVPAETDYDGRPFLGRIETRGRTVIAVEAVGESAPGAIGKEALAGPAHRSPAGGRAAVYAFERMPEVPLGTRIRVAGRFLAPDGQRNPDGIDRRAWARRNGEAGVLIARSGAIEILETPVRPAGARELASALRRELGRGLAGVVGPEGSRLARCLVLGERAVLTEAESEAFLRSGTIHFLAVSGFHVALVAGGMLGLAALAGAGRKGRVAVALLAMGVYAGVTGAQPPVLRAGLMVAVWLGADLLERRRDGASSLAAAAIVILALDPLALFDPGFQLSFASVIAIAASSVFALPSGGAPPAPAAPPPLWRETARLGGRGVFTGARVGLAAWLGVLPLTLVVFDRVAAWAVPASLLLGPWVAFLLAAGLAAGIAGIAFGGGGLAAGLLAPLVTFPSSVVSDLARMFAALPGAVWVPPIPSATAVAAYYGTLVFACEARRTGKRAAATAAVGTAVLCAALWWPRAASIPEGSFRLTVFDVGHGTCVLAELPSGALVYDAGGSGGTGVARHVFEPHARRRGISRIERLVLSHADLDHVSGAPAIFDSFEVGEVWVSPRFSLSPVGKEILLRADRSRVPVRLVQAGERIPLGEGAAAEVMWPPAPGSSAAGLSDNDGSLVIRLTAGGRVVWLTGDVERRGWRRFLESAPPGGTPADLLLAPHHGSPGAWEEALAERLRPAWVVISSSDRFGYRPVAESWRRRGAEVRCTAEVGAVIVTPAESGLRVVGWQEGE